MPVRHSLLAVLVSILWGLNFIAIYASLEHFPPLFCAGLRFLLIAIPTVLLVPRPDVPLRWLIGYGAGFGTLQFIGLYLGMAAGFPAGLASLVLQSSAPFTVLLGALLLRERLTPRQIVGVSIAVAGLGLVGLARGTATSWGPFLLVIFGGFGWALGNLASRKAATSTPLQLTLWMSVVPPLPLLALSLTTEGPQQIGDALAGSLSAEAFPAWIGLAYTIVCGTMIGSGIWVWLMARHPASRVAPFSMLVPITGLLAGWALLDERPALPELAGAVLVIGGVLWAATRSRRVSSGSADPGHEPTGPISPQPTMEPA